MWCILLHKRKKKFYIRHLEPLRISAYSIVQWSVTISGGRPLSADRHTKMSGYNGFEWVYNILKCSENSFWPQDLLKICPVKCKCLYNNWLWQTKKDFFNAKEPQLSGPGWLSCDQTLLQFELRLTFFGSRLPSQGSLKKFRKGGSFGCKTVYMRYWGPKFSCF